MTYKNPSFPTALPTFNFPSSLNSTSSCGFVTYPLVLNFPSDVTIIFPLIYAAVLDKI